MQPSNETEAEALQRRQVEALEAIAEHLETLAGAVEHLENIETLAGAVEHLETLASAVEPARQAWRDPEGYGPDYPGNKAHLRTSG
jgi:hypothetical protein